nr:hypothetical protein [Mucilaginibacter sp. X5P1]
MSKGLIIIWYKVSISAHVIARSEAIPDCARLLVLVFTYHVKPLIAAEASSFVLTQKNQKVKTKRSFRPQAKHPGPRFLSGLCPL